MIPKITVDSYRSSYFLAILLVILLTACSGSKIHQTYEGPAKLPVDVSIVSVPESFNILFTDRKKFGSTLYSGDTKLGFLPGPHQIIIYYKDFWEAPGDEYDRVESKPISIKFNAVAGQQYRVNYKKPENLEQARAYAKSPSIELINLTTNTNAATNVEYNVYTTSFFSKVFSDESGAIEEPAPGLTTGITATPAPTTPVPTPKLAAPASSTDAASDTKTDARALDMLKYWWESASDDQKKAFHDWIGK